ncbi:MAG TPA: hypothetical protein VIH99_09130 [Bdellovibrionota bacterium]
MKALFASLPILIFLLPSAGFAAGGTPCEDFRKAKLEECKDKWVTAQKCSACTKQGGDCTAKDVCGGSSSIVKAKAEECTQAAKKTVASSTERQTNVDEEAACSLLEGALMMFGSPDSKLMRTPISKTRPTKLMKTPIYRKPGPTIQRTPISIQR